MSAITTPVAAGSAQVQAATGSTPFPRLSYVESHVVKFLLWLILLILCWPLALLALILYPFVWLLMLPLRLIGVTASGVFSLLKSLLTLPARVLQGPKTVEGQPR